MKRRGTVAAPVSEDDVLRAIDRLKVLEGLVRALHRRTEAHHQVRP